MAFRRYRSIDLVTAKHSLMVNNTECLIQIKLELQGLQVSDRKILHL